MRAPYTISDLETDAEVADPSPWQAKFLTTLREFDTYIRANAGSIPNYGERRRADEVISSSIAESAVNQVISKRMSRNSRCGGAPAAPTCSYSSAPGFSTTHSPTTSTGGTQDSPTCPTDRRWPRNLPQFVPLS